MVRQRVRIRFAKQGDLRLIGHIDLVRAWERLLRRADVRPRMSEGFTPRPRMSFPSALSVGICGANEVMELDLNDDATYTADVLRETLARHAPPGLIVRQVAFVPADRGWAEARRATYEIEVPVDRRAAVENQIARFLAADEWLVHRGEGRKPFDIRPCVEQLRLVAGVLQAQTRLGRQGTVRPRELLAAVGIEDLEHQGLWLTRTDIEVEP